MLLIGAGSLCGMELDRYLYGILLFVQGWKDAMDREIRTVSRRYVMHETLSITLYNSWWLGLLI